MAREEQIKNKKDKLPNIIKENEKGENLKIASRVIASALISFVVGFSGYHLIKIDKNKVYTLNEMRQIDSLALYFGCIATLSTFTIQTICDLREVNAVKKGRKKRQQELKSNIESSKNRAAEPKPELKKNYKDKFIEQFCKDPNNIDSLKKLFDDLLPTEKEIYKTILEDHKYILLCCTEDKKNEEDLENIEVVRDMLQANLNDLGIVDENSTNRLIDFLEKELKN
jgi:hypothetical protein